VFEEEDQRSEDNYL